MLRRPALHFIEQSSDDHLPKQSVITTFQESGASHFQSSLDGAKV